MNNSLNIHALTPNKMKSKLLLVLAFAVSLIFTACNKDDESVTPANTSASMSFSFNGTTKTVESNKIFAASATQGGTTYVAINAYMGSDTVAMTCPLAVGSYPVTFLAGNTIFAYSTSSEDYIATEGTVVVTSIADKKITGTFTASSPSGGLFSPFTVTNGKFANVTYL